MLLTEPIFFTHFEFSIPNKIALPELFDEEYLSILNIANKIICGSKSENGWLSLNNRNMEKFSQKEKQLD